MSSSQRNLEIYREIADLEEGRGSAQTRDRFQILAADAALQAGDHGEADAAARPSPCRPIPIIFSGRTPPLPRRCGSADVASYVADPPRLLSPPARKPSRLLEDLCAQGGAGPEVEASPGARPATVPFREEDHRTIEEPTSNLDFLNLERQPGQRPRRKPPSLTEIDVGGTGAGAASERRATEGTCRFCRARTDRRRNAKRPYHRRQKRCHLLLELHPRACPAPTAAEAPSAVNSWVATLFFVLLLIVGVALTGYTFARPYLKAPEEYFQVGQASRGTFGIALQPLPEERPARPPLRQEVGPTIESNT